MFFTSFADDCLKTTGVGVSLCGDSLVVGVGVGVGVGFTSLVVSVWVYVSMWV